MPELQGYQVIQAMEIEQTYIAYLQKDQAMAIVELDPATGTPVAIRFDQADREPGETTQSTASDAELLDRAERFLQQFRGAKEGEYRAYQVLKDSLSVQDDADLERRVVLYRYVNGIRFDRDYYMVTLNPAGDVISCTHAGPFFTDQQFPAADGLIGVEAANKALYSSFQLQYISRFRESVNVDAAEAGEVRPLLMYAPFTGSPVDGQIDARTGEVYAVNGSPQQVSLQPPPSPLALNTVEGATVFVQNGCGVDLSGLEAKVAREENQIRYRWELGQNNAIELLVNAHTGELILFQGEGMGRQVLVQPEAARETVVRAVEKLLSPAAKEGYIKELIDVQGSDDKIYWARYFYIFYESRNGIIVADSGYQVEVNPETGQVMLIRRTGSPAADLPDPSTAVAPEAAYREYQNVHPLELIYTLQEGSVVPTLVYQPAGDRDVHIDAVAGRAVRGQTGDEFRETED